MNRLLWLLFFIAVPSQAVELRVAVASNFAATAHLLAEKYTDISGDQIVLLVGSTGKHAAQIQRGLEVDVFLAADAKRPQILEQQGAAVAGSRFNYALGRLVLSSVDEAKVDSKGQVLSRGEFQRLAIANPKLAPYGQAAIEVLEALGISAYERKLVKGDSVGQAYQFVSSGNADLGLLAYSQVKPLQVGSHWLVPNDLHQAIVQTGVIIQDSPAARRFVDYLKSGTALALIEAQGYARP